MSSTRAVTSLTLCARPRERELGDGIPFSNALQLVEPGSGDHFGTSSAPFSGLNVNSFRIGNNSASSSGGSNNVSLFSSTDSLRFVNLADVK